MDPIKQICRFCLAEEDLLTDCTLYDDAVQAKITTVFSFPVNSDASLPSSICTGCYREALTSQGSIKLESTEVVVLDKPIATKEPVTIDHQKTIIKTEVAFDEVVTEDDETQVLSYDANQCIVQSQGEMLQLKIEFEDTELQSEGEPCVDQVNKTTEEDRLIKKFFSLICETCSTQFDNFTQLKQHTREKHKKKLSLTCCNKQYFRRCLVLDHIASHNNLRPFQCDSCDKMFRRKTDLANHHLLLHSGEEARPFKCDQCMRSYPKRHLLTSHINKKHDNNKATCDVCNQVYPNRRTMQMHMIRVHVEAAHECEVCGKKFKRKIQLREHKAIHTGEKLYSCNLCGLQMNSSSYLYTHRRKKHPKESAERKQKEQADSPTELDRL